MCDQDIQEQLITFQDKNALLQPQFQNLLQSQTEQSNVQNMSTLTSPAFSDNAVYRVGIKFPSFWPDKPEVWFAQAEA